MREFIKFILHYKIFRNLIIYIVVIVSGVFILEYSIDYIFSQNIGKPESPGVCFFKFSNEEGCIQANSVNDCKNDITFSGAIFVKYISNESPDKYDCHLKRATHAWVENTAKHVYLNDFSFPIRSVLNYDAGPTLFNNKAITKSYMPVLYFFIVSFLTLLYFRRKHEFISFPFIVLVSTFIACFVLCLQNLTGSFQLYIKILDSAKLLSDVILYFWFCYAAVYIMIASLYHVRKFEKGEITPLVMSFIFFVDKAKATLNL